MHEGLKCTKGLDIFGYCTFIQKTGVYFVPVAVECVLVGAVIEVLAGNVSRGVTWKVFFFFFY